MKKLLTASMVGLVSAFSMLGLCFMLAETLADVTAYQSIVWFSKGVFLIVTPPLAIITGILSAASVTKYQVYQPSGK